MGRTVRIDDLANVVMEGLQEYADLATDSMKAAVKKAGNTVKTDISVKKVSNAFLAALMGDLLEQCAIWVLLNPE